MVLVLDSIAVAALDQVLEKRVTLHYQILIGEGAGELGLRACRLGSRPHALIAHMEVLDL